MHDLGPVPLRLKRLRELADPALSVRAMAEKLEVPLSTYATYENPERYKKSLLPQAFTQKVADVLVQHGIEASHVLALAGLNPSGDLSLTPHSMAEQLDAVLVAEIDVGYSMGGGSDVGDFPVVQMVPLSRAWLRSLTDADPSQIFVARGDGDSMMPTLLDNDYVIIDRSQKRLAKQDRIWALVYAGFGMIKRLRALPDGTLQINSDNASVTPISATQDEAFIIGRVVGIIRRI